MKYVLESDLNKFRQKEARGTGKKKAFVSDLYGGGVLINGEILVPVFDSLDEIHFWENPQREFEEDANRAVMDVIIGYTGLSAAEVAKSLDRESFFGNFFQNLKVAIDSVKCFLGEKIEGNTKEILAKDAEHANISEIFMVRSPSGDENVHDNILYLVSTDNLAKDVASNLRLSGEDDFGLRNAYIYPRPPKVLEHD